MYTYETLQFTVCNIKENKKRKCKNFAFYMFREKMRNVRKLRNAKNFAKKNMQKCRKKLRKFREKICEKLRAKNICENFGKKFEKKCKIFRKFID